MLAKILLVDYCLLFPVLVINLGPTYSFIRKIESNVICYIVGLVIGNIGILLSGLEGMNGILTSISVPITILFLLFSEYIRKWVNWQKQPFQNSKAIQN